MPESKAAFWDRAAKSGFRSEALAYREQQKKRLRAEGSLDDKANAKEAIRLTMEAFPPGTGPGGKPRTELRPPGTSSTSGDAKLRLALAAQGRTASVADDVEWVYQNLALPLDRLDPEEVPSQGAVGLLWQAQIDPAWFLTTYHAKLLPKLTANESTHALRDDGRIVGLIEQLVSEFPSDHAHQTHQLWEDCGEAGAQTTP